MSVALVITGPALRLTTSRVPQNQPYDAEPHAVAAAGNRKLMLRSGSKSEPAAPLGIELRTRKGPTGVEDRGLTP